MTNSVKNDWNDMLEFAGNVLTVVGFSLLNLTKLIAKGVQVLLGFIVSGLW